MIVFLLDVPAVALAAVIGKISCYLLMIYGALQDIYIKV